MNRFLHWLSIPVLNPESDRLEAYEQYDWTDKEVVASIQEARREYHDSKESMINKMITAC